MRYSILLAVIVSFLDVAILRADEGLFSEVAMESVFEKSIASTRTVASQNNTGKLDRITGVSSLILALKAAGHDAQEENGRATFNLAHDGWNFPVSIGVQVDQDRIDCEVSLTKIGDDALVKTQTLLSLLATSDTRGASFAYDREAKLILFRASLSNRSITASQLKADLAHLATVAEKHSDPASAERPDVPADYAAALSNDALRGKRIGVIRSYYGSGEFPAIESMLQQVIVTLQRQGAEIVDPIELETEGMGDAESAVLKYEFKQDLRRYFKDANAPMSDLADVIAFNDEYSIEVMPIFGQNILLESQEMGPLTDEAYLTALADSKRISRRAIDAAMAEHKLDALIAPTNGPAWLTDHVNGDSFHVGSSSFAAVSGYANITVPAGFVSGLPVGISFIGGAYTEKTLIDIAYAFEQASKVRKAPALD